MLDSVSIAKNEGRNDPVIPLDETIETMYRVGKSLPEELRCTCKGGLCMTDTAKKCMN